MKEYLLGMISSKGKYGCWNICWKISVLRRDKIEEIFYWK